jgi:Glycosyl transferase family 11
MQKVYVKFPKVGLGNMMLVWARAVVFARLNNLEYSTSSWWGFKWGALIRGEKRKRWYWRYFMESPLSDRLSIQLFLMKVRLNGTGRADIIRDPAVAVIDGASFIKRDQLFIFNKVITNEDLFGEIRMYQPVLKSELQRILHPRIIRILHQHPSPVISIHVRRGDFKSGNPITALSFFIEGIKIIRDQTKSEWPVTVFTDAEENELQPLLQMPGVYLQKNQPDIVDILLMSKSKIILLSQSSSFSYWAAFLSEALVIIPMNDWQRQIGRAYPESLYKEIRWQEGDENATIEFKTAVKKMIGQNTMPFS